TLAALYRAGDRLDPARALLQAALDAQRQVSGDASAATATLLARLGGLERAAGRNDKAREHVARALSLAEALPPAQAPQAVTVWLTAGFAALNDGDARTASAHFERAAPLADATVPPDASARIEAQFGLASARHRAGDAAGAEGPAGRAVELTARHFGADHGRMAGPLSAWANVQRALGRPEQAIEFLQRTLQLLTREYGPQAASVLAARNNLALALEAAGDPARAQQELATVVTLRRSLQDGGAADILDLAGAYQNLGSSLARHGQGAEALTPLGRAQEIYDRELPADSALRAFPRLSAALAHLDLQQPAAAERMAAGAGEILERSVGAGHAAHAAARCLHGEALVRLGRPAQGSTLVREAVVPLRTAGPGVATYAERCARVAATLASP
ncbi:MAG: tetratricopeptide repeat protein, partial [Rhodoferax sp.]|nr:tetratricopeptide repeat protein [Rhodoferax sp.]